MNVVLFEIALKGSAVSKKFIMNWLVFSISLIDETSVWSNFAVAIADHRKII